MSVMKAVVVSETKRFFLIANSTENFPIVQVMTWLGKSLFSMRHDLVRAGMLNKALILNQEGELFDVLTFCEEGVDFRIFAEQNLLGKVLEAVTMGFSFLTRTHMVVVRVETSLSKTLSLEEAKKLLISGIGRNKNVYTHAPPKALIGRISRAASLEIAMESFWRD